MIADGELPWRFSLHSVGAFSIRGHLFGLNGFLSTWLEQRARDSFFCCLFVILVSVSGVRLHPSPTLLCLCLTSSPDCSPSLFSPFVPDSHASICWRVSMLHAMEGPQLHRCVAWLAVFSIRLEQPPLQDHRP